MVPSREIFWNIQLGEILYLLGAIVLGIFVYALYRRYRLWRLGGSDNRLSRLGKRVRVFIVTAIVDGLLHRKFFGVAPSWRSSIKDFLPKEFYPGIAHFLIFGGCLILLLGALLDFISHYLFHFMYGDFYLGYSVVVDAAGILVLIGVILAIIRRYVQKPDRLDNKGEDLIALLLILIVVVTGFIVEGFRIAATELQTTSSWAPWSPGGFVLAQAFSGLSQDTLLTWHRVMWWSHVVITFGAITYIFLYWNKLWHIIVCPLNIFFRSLEPKGALIPIDLETVETLGVVKIDDFTWKQLMDLDACTRCGRCQDACPAYISGKPLSPKKMTQDLKAHWLERAPILLKSKAKAQGANPRDEGRSLIGEVVAEDEIWACTTCGACAEQCPVTIEHISKVIDMRRNLVMVQNKIPETAERALRTLMTRGDPWPGTMYLREDWSKELEIKKLSQDSNVDVLYWVGCSGSLSEINIPVTQSLVKVLTVAGVKFGILGTEESCCGDPARRLGHEVLFQTQALRNIETLKRYNVRRIVTHCPHCYNTIAHEYPQFGGNFEVIHYTELIAELIKEGKLKISGSFNKTITYHDPCYLGRHNGIYEAPRAILKALPGVNLVEMSRCKYESFCCGGGGGHLWLEEQIGQRINEIRIKDVIDVNADIVATACPYCQQMFEEAIERKKVKESLQAWDIIQLVEQAGPYRVRS